MDAGRAAGAVPAVPMRAMLQLQRVATTILAAGLGLEDALVAVVEGSEAVLECERVALYVIDWRANAMRLTVSTAPIEEGIKLRLGSGLVGACATEARVLNVADAYADERFDPTVDLCTAKKTQSALCVPIMGDDSRVCAVLCALNKLPSPPTPPREAPPSADAPAAAFSGADEYLLSSVAVMAGHALSRMRSQYAARRAEAVNAEVLDVTKQLSGMVDTAQVAQLVRARLAPLLRATVVNVFLLESPGTMVLASDPGYVAVGATTPRQQQQQAAAAAGSIAAPAPAPASAASASAPVPALRPPSSASLVSEGASGPAGGDLASHRELRFPVGRGIVGLVMQGHTATLNLSHPQGHPAFDAAVDECSLPEAAVPPILPSRAVQQHLRRGLASMLSQSSLLSAQRPHAGGDFGAALPPPLPSPHRRSASIGGSPRRTGLLSADQRSELLGDARASRAGVGDLEAERVSAAAAASADLEVSGDLSDSRPRNAVLSRRHSQPPSLRIPAAMPFSSTRSSSAASSASGARALSDAAERLRDSTPLLGLMTAAEAAAGDIADSEDDAASTARSTSRLGLGPDVSPPQPQPPRASIGTTSRTARLPQPALAADVPPPPPEDFGTFAEAPEGSITQRRLISRASVTRLKLTSSFRDDPRRGGGVTTPVAAIAAPGGFSQLGAAASALAEAPYPTPKLERSHSGHDILTPKTVISGLHSLAAPGSSEPRSPMGVALAAAVEADLRVSPLLSAAQSFMLQRLQRGGSMPVLSSASLTAVAQARAPIASAPLLSARAFSDATAIDSSRSSASSTGQSANGPSNDAVARGSTGLASPTYIPSDVSTSRTTPDQQSVAEILRRQARHSFASRTSMSSYALLQHRSSSLRDVYTSLAGSSPSARGSNTSRTFTTQGSNDSAPSVMQKGGAGRTSIVSSTVPRGLERARFMVVAPVKDQAGNVVGVIQAINKAAPAVGWEHRPRVVGGGGTVVSARSGRSGHSSLADDVSVRGPMDVAADLPSGAHDVDALSPADRSSTSPDLHWAAAEALSVSLQVLLSAPRTPQSVSSAEPSAQSRQFAYTPKASPAAAGPRLHFTQKPPSGLPARHGVAAAAATSPTVSAHRGRSFRHSAGTLLSPTSSKAPLHPDSFSGLVSPSVAAAARDKAFAAASEPSTAGADSGSQHSQSAPVGSGPADPTVVSFSKGWAAAAAALTEDLQSRQFVPFSGGDVATIESLAMSVGGCLHRAHMFEAVLRSQRKAEALLEIVRATASEQSSFFALARRLVNAANHALGADRVSLFLVDPRERELWCAVSDDVEGWRFAPGTGIIGHVARTGVGVNVADARTLDYFDARLDRVLSYATRSVLCLPVVDNRGRVLAVMQALNKLKFPFSGDNKSSSGSREFPVHGTSPSAASASSPPRGAGKRPVHVLPQVPEVSPTPTVSTHSAGGAGGSGLSPVPEVAPRPARIVPFDDDDSEILQACCLELAIALNRTSVEVVILTGKASVGAGSVDRPRGGSGSLDPAFVRAPAPASAVTSPPPQLESPAQSQGPRIAAGGSSANTAGPDAGRGLARGAAFISPSRLGSASTSLPPPTSLMSAPGSTQQDRNYSAFPVPLAGIDATALATVTEEGLRSTFPANGDGTARSVFEGQLIPPPPFPVAPLSPAAVSAPWSVASLTVPPEPPSFIIPPRGLSMTPRAMALLCPGADAPVDDFALVAALGPTASRRGSVDARQVAPSPLLRDDVAPPLHRISNSASMLSVLSIDGRQHSSGLLSASGAVGIVGVVSRSASAQSLPTALQASAQAHQQHHQQQQQLLQHSTDKMMSYISTFSLSPFVGEGAVAAPTPPPAGIDDGSLDHLDAQRRGSTDDLSEPPVQSERSEGLATDPSWGPPDSMAGRAQAEMLLQAAAMSSAASAAILSPSMKRYGGLGRRQQSDISASSIRTAAAGGSAGLSAAGIGGRPASVLLNRKGSLEGRSLRPSAAPPLPGNAPVALAASHAAAFAPAHMAPLSQKKRNASQRPGLDIAASLNVIVTELASANRPASVVRVAAAVAAASPATASAVMFSAPSEASFALQPGSVGAQTSIEHAPPSSTPAFRDAPATRDEHRAMGSAQSFRTAAVGIVPSPMEAAYASSASVGSGALSEGSGYPSSRSNLSSVSASALAGGAAASFMSREPTPPAPVTPRLSRNNSAAEDASLSTAAAAPAPVAPSVAAATASLGSVAPVLLRPSASSASLGLRGPPRPPGSGCPADPLDMSDAGATFVEEIDDGEAGDVTGRFQRPRFGGGRQRLDPVTPLLSTTEDAPAAGDDVTRRVGFVSRSASSTAAAPSAISSYPSNLLLQRAMTQRSVSSSSSAQSGSVGGTFVHSSIRIRLSAIHALEERGDAVPPALRAQVQRYEEEQQQQQSERRQSLARSHTSRSLQHDAPSARGSIGIAQGRRGSDELRRQRHRHATAAGVRAGPGPSVEDDTPLSEPGNSAAEDSTSDADSSALQASFATAPLPAMNAHVEGGGGGRTRRAAVKRHSLQLPRGAGTRNASSLLPAAAPALPFAVTTSRRSSEPAAASSTVSAPAASSVAAEAVTEILRNVALAGSSTDDGADVDAEAAARSLGPTLAAHYLRSASRSTPGAGSVHSLAGPGTPLRAAPAVGFELHPQPVVTGARRSSSGGMSAGLSSPIEKLPDASRALPVTQIQAAAEAAAIAAAEMPRRFSGGSAASFPGADLARGSRRAAGSTLPLSPSLAPISEEYRFATTEAAALPSLSLDSLPATPRSPGVPTAGDVATASPDATDVASAAAAELLIGLTDTPSTPASSSGGGSPARRARALVRRSSLHLRIAQLSTSLQQQQASAAAAVAAALAAAPRIPHPTSPSVHLPLTPTSAAAAADTERGASADFSGDSDAGAESGRDSCAALIAALEALQTDPLPPAQAAAMATRAIIAALPASIPCQTRWTFNVWEVPLAAFGPLFVSLADRLGLLSALPVVPVTLLRFLEAGRDRYWRSNSFHNQYHGMHVAQATFMLLRATGAGDPAVLPRSEQLALLIAAFMHDVDHPGVSNAFLSNVEDSLALRYNDASVLESHHAALTCELLRDKDGGLDVFAHFSLPERRRMRAYIIGAILATDMTKHFGEVVPAAKALTLPLCRPTDADGVARRPEAISKERDRLGEVLLHAADLSGQVLPWPLAEQWSDRIVVEFRVQAALEAAAGVPFTPHMHGLFTLSEVATLQIGFLEYVLAPLWRALADVFTPLAPRLEQLDSNAAHYRRLKAAFDAHADLPEPPPPVVDLRFDVDEDEAAAAAAAFAKDADADHAADDEADRSSVRDRAAAGRGPGGLLPALGARGGNAVSRKAAAFVAAVAAAREREGPTVAAPDVGAGASDAAAAAAPPSSWHAHSASK